MNSLYFKRFPSGYSNMDPLDDKCGGEVTDYQNISILLSMTLFMFTKIILK